MLPTAFASWREVLQEVRQEREIEALRQEVVEKDVSTRIVETALRREVQEKEREIEALRLEMGMLKVEQGRRAAAAKKALAAMISTQRIMLQRTVFVGWRETSRELKQKQEIDSSSEGRKRRRRRCFWSQWISRRRQRADRRKLSAAAEAEAVAARAAAAAAEAAARS